MRLGFLLIISVLSGSIIMMNSCSSLTNISRTPVALPPTLKLVDVFTVPFNMEFNGTTVGGLSGIDYDRVRNIYYLVCDDRSQINPARFYTAKIDISAAGIDTIFFVKIDTLKNRDTLPYPAKTIDPEALRYDSLRERLVWSSEGDRIASPGKEFLQDPLITMADLNGLYLDSFILPNNMRMNLAEKGPRQNGVFEGLTFTDDYQSLFVSVEEPLYQDGPRASTKDSSGFVRIIKYDIESRRQLAQYTYKIDPVAHVPDPPSGFKVNGIPDILFYGNEQLLVMERSFSTGRAANTIKIYLADLKGATDVSKSNSVLNVPGLQVVQKKLLLNMDDLGIYTDNLEGVTFGPTLPNGHRTLLFISDNNFSQNQQTQLYLFEIL